MIGDVDRNVTITFIGRDNASRAMGSIGSSASRTTSTVSKLTTALKYVGVAAATALAAGAMLAAKALWDATKAAYYDDIAMKKLALTQKKAQDATRAQTEATAKLIDKLELATGIADDEMRPAMAALAATGMDVEKSHRLLNIALDVSVARGKSVQTVSEALAKAYNGQLTGLQRLGVKVTDASGDALSFAEVLRQLEDRFGGAARAAGKTDPLKRLEAAWNQMKEKVGEGLLPVLREFTEWIIREGVPWVRKELVPAIRDLGRWIKNNHETIESWGRGLQATARVLATVWAAVRTVAGWLQSLYYAIKRVMGSDTSFLDDLQVSLFLIERPGLVVKEIMNDIRSAIDSVTSAIGRAVGAIYSFISAAAKIPSIDLPIPGLASGGWIKGRAMGGWTMVGEHGPELISNRGYVKTASQTMGARGGSVVVNIYGPTDAVGAGREVRKALLSLKRAEGGRALGLA